MRPARRALLGTKAFSLYSECDGEPAEGFEQRNGPGGVSRSPLAALWKIRWEWEATVKAKKPVRRPLQYSR